MAKKTQHVSGYFSVSRGSWVKTIPNTEHDPDGSDLMSPGLECYGIGPADGLGDDAEVLVTDADYRNVALGEITDTYGFVHPNRGNCRLAWSVDVPKSETGVLTVTFAENPQWAIKFTLAQMTAAPHRLDFVSIG